MPAGMAQMLASMGFRVKTPVAYPQISSNLAMKKIPVSTINWIGTMHILAYAFYAGQFFLNGRHG
jgi:hypothetical protein